MFNTSSLRTIRIVASREIGVALRSKAIVGSIIFYLVLALGAIGLFTYLDSRDDGEAETIAVVDLDPAYFESTSYQAQTAPDRSAAIDMLDDEATAAVVPANATAPDDTGWELLTDGLASPELSATVSAAIEASAHAAAMAELGISPEDYQRAAGATQMITTDISSDEDTNFAGTLTTMLASMIMLSSLFLFAANVGGRVTAEKSSRVVEIILATVRPGDFLAGKILGNTVIGFVATVLILGISGLALQFSGLIDSMEIDFDWTLIPILLVGFVLGMIFFSCLYAAAGAMVQRTEDLQSTQAPILVLLLGTIYATAFSFTTLGSTWAQVIAWIPPLSTTMAPMQFTAGNMQLWQVAASYGLLALTCVVAIWIVGRIYRNAILNNGRKMTWFGALSRKN